MEIVDANIILRFILDDNKELSDRATEIVENQNLYILEEVIAEVIYVLEKVYKMDRKDIADTLLEFIEFENIFIDNTDVIKSALEKYKEIKIDFVDTVLYWYSKCRNAKIYTFDKKLENMINREEKREHNALFFLIIDNSPVVLII